MVLCAEINSGNRTTIKFTMNRENDSNKFILYLPSVSSVPLTWDFLNLLTSYSEAINSNVFVVELQSTLSA